MPLPTLVTSFLLYPSVGTRARPTGDWRAKSSSVDPCCNLHGNTKGVTDLGPNIHLAVPCTVNSSQKLKSVCQKLWNYELRKSEEVAMSLTRSNVCVLISPVCGHLKLTGNDRCMARLPELSFISSCSTAVCLPSIPTDLRNGVTEQNATLPTLL